MHARATCSHEPIQTVVNEITGGQFKSRPEGPVGPEMPDRWRPARKKLSLVKRMLVVASGKSGTNPKRWQICLPGKSRSSPCQHEPGNHCHQTNTNDPSFHLLPLPSTHQACIHC